MIARVVCLIRGHHPDPNRCDPPFCLRCRRSLYERPVRLSLIERLEDAFDVFPND